MNRNAASESAAANANAGLRHNTIDIAPASESTVHIQPAFHDAAARTNSECGTLAAIVDCHGCGIRVDAIGTTAFRESTRSRNDHSPIDATATAIPSNVRARSRVHAALEAKAKMKPYGLSNARTPIAGGQSQVSVAANNAASQRSLRKLISCVAATGVASNAHAPNVPTNAGEPARTAASRAMATINAAGSRAPHPAAPAPPIANNALANSSDAGGYHQ